MPGKGLKFGTNGHKGGRKKGAKNKVGLDLRQKITLFLEDQWETIEEDFKQLSPKDRMIYYEKLLDHALPKLQSVDIHGNLERSLSQFSDDQLEEIFERIIQFQLQPKKQ